MSVIVRVPSWSPTDNEITNHWGVSNALKSRLLSPASMVNMLLWHNGYVLKVVQDTTVGGTRLLVCHQIDETGPASNEWALFHTGMMN